MQQKKSGKQKQEIEKARIISSDFNNPNLFCSQFNLKSPDFAFQNNPHLTIRVPNPSPPPPAATTHGLKEPNFHHLKPSSSNNASPTHTLLSTPPKRSIMTHNSFSRPRTLDSFKNHRAHCERVERLALFQYFSCSACLVIPFDAQQLGRKLVHHLNRGRFLCFHLRFLFLLYLPSLYFLVSDSRWFFLLNFVGLFAFSLTLLVSINLTLPRLPSIRLLLARSLPSKFSQLGSSSKSSKTVVWSIGSKPKSEKVVISGSWVQVYSNGDVYEGEFHKGKCSGSGVYYYYMKGRYEGDWIDGKYDGYGVETWAKGSRYRGQYRHGLRHGIGVYRFYTGDVYAGEWSNGHCHGRGVHTCADGSNYVGEFKWGVKHGLGHYHFR